MAYRPSVKLNNRLTRTPSPLPAVRVNKVKLYKKSNREQHKNRKLCAPGSSEEPKGYLFKLLADASSRVVMTHSKMIYIIATVNFYKIIIILMVNEVIK